MSIFLEYKKKDHPSSKNKIIYRKHLAVIYLLIAQICFPLFIFASLEKDESLEISQFLHLIASTETEQWEDTIEALNRNFSTLIGEASVAKCLHQLKSKILKEDDLELIKLYHRAIRNHDTLSNEQAGPVPTYYKHYQSPDFFVPAIELIFDVADSEVCVTSKLSIQRNSQKEMLVLDGKEHKVDSLFINGQLISKEQYRVTPHELIVFDIPTDEHFQVTIHSVIDPFKNLSLEGMYRCGEWLTTQCESEGARRIFFTLDRPDVLSRIKTTIIADKERYPYRLSNGNLVSEYQEDDGRWVVTWEDPFPKPSYLFACVLGRFSQLVNQFTTRSGKEVELQIYVEPGKEERAKYAFFALQQAMEFDELFFDREYDLSCLKMVAIPDFNSGAMENKGLMIFNDLLLLVDPSSGTDRSYRGVAHVVAHEYFHNWSGNRVTVRNWYEIALKEAFTDLRAMLFCEWMFGEEFVRPKAVQLLKETQFPEEMSEKGHSLIVESYVDAHSIYDSTTYIKGREVFRMLKNYMDLLIPQGFREAQNLYFSRYDGQAVTFQELLTAGNEILKAIDKDLLQFERWFYQPGTPVVHAEMEYDSLKKEAIFLITQSCPHPRTGVAQAPFHIPFSVELMGKNGDILSPKLSCMLENETTSIHLPSSEKPTPVFMHGFSAPVILNYSYTLEDLGCIMKYADDAFCRWEAAQNYFILALEEMKNRIEKDPALEIKAKQGELLFTDLYQLYQEVLDSPQLSPLAKAVILNIPSIRAISEVWKNYDFERIHQLRSLFVHQLAHFCKPSLERLLEEYPVPEVYEPIVEHMQVRELRHMILSFLRIYDEYKEKILEQYKTATHFDSAVSAFNLCLTIDGASQDFVVADFYEQWKRDKAVFNFWLSSQAASSQCTLDKLRKLEKVEGYDPKNPNHVRSIFRTFIDNLKCYHSPDGEGYQYIVDKILEIAQFNPLLAHNNLMVPAFLDFEKLPNKQKLLMKKALERLREGDIPPQTRDLIERMLAHDNEIR